MKFNIGQKAQFSKTISESDVYLFAGITGDMNPIHVNEVFAKTTRFGKRIVHGMLVSSFISSALSMKLFGENTVYVSQEIKFLKPVFIGDTITVTLEIIEIMEKGRHRVSSCIYNQEDVMVVEGISIVIPPRVD